MFEDPIPKEDFDEYARLRQEMQGTGIPLALHLGRADDLRRAIDGGCIDVVNASPLSMVTFVEMAAMAEAAGIPCWHGSGNDCGPMDLAYVHACAAAPSCTLPSDIMGNRLHVEHFLDRAHRLRRGLGLAPGGAGPGGRAGPGGCGAPAYPARGSVPLRGATRGPVSGARRAKGTMEATARAAAASRAVCPPAPAAITPSKAGPMM